jgi:lipopolysaccharide export system protein LptA
MRILPYFLTCALALGALSFSHAAEVESQKTTLTCEKMDMWSEGEETKAICTGKVTVTGTNLRIVCDRLELTATRVGKDDAGSAVPDLDKFRYLLATGNVSITQGTRTATCGRAEVLPLEDKVVLTENPVVTDTAAEFVSAGERITMLRGQERVFVENAKFTGPPIKDLGFEKKSEEEKAEAVKKETPPPGAVTK